MRKRCWKYFTLLISLLGFTMTLSTTNAWFSQNYFYEPDVPASGHSAYFEKGDGSETNPFSIRSPYHLYNLAWLQYLGKFNNEDGTRYHFKLSDNLTSSLNMTGYTLPPIGTTTYPFVGYFDGNGKTIENLSISNTFTDFNQTPYLVSGADFNKNKESNVNIVGFFGVLGPFANDTLTYSSIADQVKDFKLDHITINTSSSTSLVGALAGYVNGEIENVAINNATLNVPSGTNAITSLGGENNSNVSNYSTVGFCTADYIGTQKENVTNIYNVNEERSNFTAQVQGTDTGWGGSIDMKTMYDHLLPKHRSSSRSQYYARKTISYDEEGNSTESYTNLTNNPTFSGGRFYYSETNEVINNQEIASYTFSHDSQSERFMYLSGQKERTVSNGLRITETYPGGFLIADNIGNYLRRASTTTVSNATVQDDASIWYFDNSNHIYSLQGTTKYYLQDNNGSLAVSSTGNTVWNYSNNTLRSDSNRYLVCDASNWILSSTSTIAGYKIRYNNYYLNVSGTTDIASGTDANNASVWHIESGTSYVYSIINNTRYYLYYVNNDALHISTSTNQTYMFILQNNSLVIEGYTSYSTYYYNGRWRIDSTVHTLTFTSSNIVQVGNVSRSSTADASYTTRPTYFPLQFDTTTGGVSIKNTGYVVSGATDLAGDIRVSQYYTSDLSGSLTYSSNSYSAPFIDIYTIDGSGIHTISNESTFEKLASSKASMEKVISGSRGSIYGLHFMNAAISASNKVTAKYASVNGSPMMANYELPGDSIDFHLKEKGYINFFAGTYYPGNNSFFSIHEVIRNESDNTKLSDIREITGVYSDGNSAHSYIYSFGTGNNIIYSKPYTYGYKNGQRVKVELDAQGNTTSTDYVEHSTTASLASGYSKVFDTAWIKTNSSISSSYMNRAFYFEIPMNDGEYCLGSVDGGTGAYLMYLDIAANANMIYRTTVSEKIEETTNRYYYPKGVEISTLTPTKDGNEVTGVNSSCIVIVSSPSSAVALVMSRTNNVITLTGAASKTTNSSPPVYPCYDGPDVTLANSLVSSPPTTVTKTISRMTYYDYSSATGTYSRVETTVVSYSDGTATENNVKKYDQNGVENDSVVVYDSEGYAVTNISALYDMVDVSNCTTLNFSFNYMTADGVNLTHTYTLTLSVTTGSNNELLWSVNGYTVLVSHANDGSAVTINVTEKNGTLVITLNGHSFTVTDGVVTPGTVDSIAP